ncbi:MAG: thiamine pyrophosphate-dependent enzyme [Gemmatimonadota bacterium]|nr:thiamine pyrophosphate-dependent enzyme [Gemmatimonadota bacterium]
MTFRANAPQGMPIRDAVGLIRERRGPDDVVVSSMGSAREWMALGPLHALDLVLVPSAMGHVTSMGLGLALAQPARRVIVLSGDGSLLMNLGTLVTISAQAPTNLVVVVFVNGSYEVTGAQATPGAPAARANGDAVDYVAMARACGLRSVFRWSAIDEWRLGIDEALRATGPTLVVLDVETVPGAVGPRSPGPTSERGPRFMAALGVTPL